MQQLSLSHSARLLSWQTKTEVLHQWNPVNYKKTRIDEEAFLVIAFGAPFRYSVVTCRDQTPNLQLAKAEVVRSNFVLQPNCVARRLNAVTHSARNVNLIDSKVVLETSF